MNQRLERVFLTGATGFVGSHLTLAVIGGGEGVVLLARDGGTQSAAARVKVALERAASCYCEVLDQRMLEHTEVVTGDITEPFCGLDEGARQRLRGTVTEFWHFAANLTFDDRHDEELDRENRQGTEHALDLAIELGIKRFVQCSTAFVAGLRTGSIPETVFPAGGPFSNAYERTKDAAERVVVERCMRHSIDYRIVRPAIVVGPFGTKQSGGTTSGMYEVVREVYRLREQLRPLQSGINFEGRPLTPLNIMPVDWLVRDFLALRKGQFGEHHVAHLCVDDCPSVQDAFDLMSEIIGVPAIRVGPRPAGRRAPVERLLNRRVEYYNSYVTHAKMFERRQTPRRVVSVQDLRGYINRYVRELEGEVREQMFRHRTIASFDGYRLAAYEAGSPSGEPVVFVNSYGMPVDFWLPLARELESRCRITTWESRGVPSMGDEASETLAPERHVRDLEVVLDRLGVERAHLVGWCTGAEVAGAFAVSHPDRVKTLVLMNGAYASGPFTLFQDTLRSVTRRIVADGRYAEFYYKVIYGSQGGDVADDTNKMDSLLGEVDPALLYMAGIPFRTPGHLRRYAVLVEGFFEQPTGMKPERVSAPTLVISGKRDQLTRYEGSIAVSERIDGAVLDLADGSDHYRMYYDRKMMQRIRDFICSDGRSGQIARRPRAVVDTGEERM